MLRSCPQGREDIGNPSERGFKFDPFRSPTCLEKKLTSPAPVRAWCAGGLLWGGGAAAGLSALCLRTESINNQHTMTRLYHDTSSSVNSDFENRSRGTRIFARFSMS